MTTYFKATFSNGTIAKRSSVSKPYTHAYRYVSFSGYEKIGFSTSEAQAAANMASESAWGRKNRGPLQFEEVVPIIEITAKEYRAK